MNNNNKNIDNIINYNNDNAKDRILLLIVIMIL